MVMMADGTADSAIGAANLTGILVGSHMDLTRVRNFTSFRNFSLSKDSSLDKNISLKNEL